MKVVCIEMVITLLWLEKQEGEEEEHKLWQAIEDQNIIELGSIVLVKEIGALFRPLFTYMETPEHLEAKQSIGLKSSHACIMYVWR